MNRYQDRTPRAAMGFAALALTALTFGIAIFAPATQDFEVKAIPATTIATGEWPAPLAAPAPVAAVAKADPAATRVAISPSRIEVVASREPKVGVATVTSDPVQRRTATPKG